MATGSKAGLYQNAQSASYLPLTLLKDFIYILGVCLDSHGRAGNLENYLY